MAKFKLAKLFRFKLVKRFKLAKAIINFIVMIIFIKPTKLVKLI